MEDVNGIGRYKLEKMLKRNSMFFYGAGVEFSFGGEPMGGDPDDDPTVEPPSKLKERGFNGAVTMQSEKYVGRYLLFNLNWLRFLSTWTQFVSN